MMRFKDFSFIFFNLLFFVILIELIYEVDYFNYDVDVLYI